jgi:transposase
MSYGYSQNLVEANKKANARSLGVALGRLCIQSGVSVVEVAKTFGVSRMTVYNWFRGASAPRQELAERIKVFIVKSK